MITTSQSKKVVERCCIVSLYSTTNSLTRLGGKVVCGLSQKNYQPATYMLEARGAMLQMAITPNRIIKLEIYIKDKVFAPPKWVYRKVLLHLGSSSSYVLGFNFTKVTIAKTIRSTKAFSSGKYQVAGVIYFTLKTFNLWFFKSHVTLAELVS